MKKLKLLLLGIVGILGLGFSSASFSVSGVTYEDGYYWNQSKGLITVIYGTGIFTMQDKNLGAIEVYDGSASAFGSLVEGPSDRYPGYSSVCSQVGYLYQWGNNIPFTCTGFLNNIYDGIGSVELTGNHNYDNPILLNKPYLNSNNYDISDVWGGLTSSSVTQQGPCEYGYHIPNNNDWNNISDILKGTFPAGIVENKYLQKFLYLTKFPFMSSSDFNYNTIRYNSSTVGNTYNFYFTSPNYNGSDFTLTYNADFNWDYYSIFPNGDYFSWQLNISPIRCFKNIPVLPNNSWVSLSGGDTSILPPEIDDGGNSSGNDEIYSVGTDYYNVNKALIESAVWCYMTSGQYMDGSFIQGDTGCDALNYVDFIESLDVDVSSRYFDNVSKYGNLKFNDSSKVLYYYCLSDSLSYPFCNDLDFYSSTYLIYSIVAQGSGPSRLMYNIYGSGVNVAIENNGTGYFGYTTCNGIWCSEVSTGSPTYIDTSYNEYTGYDFQYLPSIDSFNVENSTGFFFNCPYPYTKVFINMDNKIIDYLGGTKLGRVINCPISAFRYGYRTLIFGDLNGTGYYWDGHLFNGNTPGHRALFMFFDILLSLIIIVILVKFYKLLSK